MTSVAVPSRRAAVRASLLDPIVAFPALWVLGVVLAQVHVLRFQTDWSSTTWLVMIAVPVAFVCGGTIGRRFAAAEAERTGEAATRVEPRTSRTLRIVLGAMAAIGFLEVIHQGASSGTIPILSESIDLARTTQSGGASVLLFELLTITAVVGLTVPERLLAKENRFEVGIALFALATLMLQGGRGLVVLPIAVAFAARWIFRGRPKLTLVIAVSALLLLAITGVFFVRASQNAEQPFQAELYNEVVPSTPDPLVPLLPVYFGLATNFSALAAVVENFPAAEPYGDGAYDALAVEKLGFEAKGIGSVSERLTPPWVTSTAAGSLWADGGLAWVVIGLALIGMLCAGGFRYAQITGTYRHSLVAGYLLYMALFSTYTNYWTTYVNWLLVIPALAIAGALAENPSNPPGLLGRGLDLLAWARGRAEVASRRVAPALAPLRRIMPSRDQISSAWKRLRSPVGIAVAALAVLVLVGFAVKEDSPEGGLTVASTVDVAKPDAAPDGRVRLATDGDLPSDNAPLWILDSAGGPGSASSVRMDEPGAGKRTTLDTDLAPAGDATLDVSRWDPNTDGDSLFRIRETGTGADVGVESLATGEGLAEGSATIPPPVPGVTRQFSIARWSGDRPDLWVIDRGLENERVRVRIYSGESAFADTLVDARLPVAGLDPERWTVDVGNAFTSVDDKQSERPDLVMVLRDGSQAGQPEVHVISGESGFQSFTLQRVMPLSEAIESDSRFVFGAVQGAGTIYAVSPLTGEPVKVRLVSFLPPAQAV